MSAVILSTKLNSSIDYFEVKSANKGGRIFRKKWKNEKNWFSVDFYGIFKAKLEKKLNFK